MNDPAEEAHFEQERHKERQADEAISAAVALAPRCGEGPEDDDTLIRCIEVQFGIPVYVTPDQQRRLHMLLTEIADDPNNQPQNGVHWISGNGSKPNWNPPLGGEPTFDGNVLFFESSAREFVSAKEKDRVLSRRGIRMAAKDLYDACKAVLKFFGAKEAWGDYASLTSAAGAFAPVAEKCREAVAKVHENWDGSHQT